MYTCYHFIVIIFFLVLRPFNICGRMWCRGVLPTALPAPFSATLSPALWVYLCKCGATGSASARTAYAICPTLRQSRSRHSHANPLHPGARLCLSYQSGYFLFPWCWSPLLFDSLSVLVVRGGAVCLPTPPFWFQCVFSKSNFLLHNHSYIIVTVTNFSIFNIDMIFYNAYSNFAN